MPGIGPDRLEKIVSAWEAQRQVNEIMLFLHGHNITTNLAVKIYKTYGDKALEVVRSNPYRLEQDIYGVGFKTADKIARDLGLPEDHPSRIEAGLVYVLNESISDGHVFLPEPLLIEQSVALLGVDPELIKPALDRLQLADRILRERVPVENEEEMVTAVYLTPYWVAEKGVAERLSALISAEVPPRQGQFQLESDDLSIEQLAALEKTLQNPVSVLTGGPGTGKTTCLKALIRLLEGWGLRFALASPTGRAAKRLSEATGRPASTIHRLLGYSPLNGFQYYEKKPLNIDFLVVDEASMLDLMLTHQLLPRPQARYAGSAGGGCGSTAIGRCGGRPAGCDRLRRRWRSPD